MVQKKVLKTFYLIFFLFGTIQCDKISMPGGEFGRNNRKQKTLDECGRCKVLTDSFHHWLKKTSRGKYEGGDAAWEEAKLKSYARSEVRLIEIQEGLCSELKKYQDYCYILAEEAEQVIEKWWFHEDSNSVDMFTSICIEALKACCPNSHFGEYCSQCPITDDKICNGNGMCDGDGTRKGNGSCICKTGYTGQHCESCAENFFSTSDGSCELCHRACSGCSGKGASACHSCKPGWQLESGVCVDIDECLSKTSCQPNEICTNKEGSFKCKPCDTTCKTCAGMGPINCTSCKPFDILWSGMCITSEQRNEIVLNTSMNLLFCIGILISIAIIIHLRFKNLIYLYFIVTVAVISYLESTHGYTLNFVFNIYQNIDVYLSS